MKVSFYNQGIIDPAAFRMMGVSVKNSTSAIGQFGTGLKYAIAGYLRLGHKVTIASGEELYEFDLQDIAMRGTVFQAVTCNGEALAYTTDYGKHWEPWQLYRELLSNALDEGGDATVDSNTVEHADTVISIEGKEVGQTHLNRASYFIPKGQKPLFSTPTVDIHAGRANGVFFKDVLIWKGGNWNYTYNLKAEADVQLTEDRTLMYSFQAKRAIAQGIATITDKEFLDSWLDMKEGEDKTADFDNVSECSEELLDLVHARLLANPTVKLPAGLRSLYKNKRGELKRAKRAFSTRQAAMVDKAKEFLSLIGYTVTAPCFLVESEGDNIFGQAKDGEIHLTKKAFEHGLNDLTRTILEEHAHLVTGHSDCTRDFQEWLFRQVILQAEERTGTYL